MKTDDFVKIMEKPYFKYYFYGLFDIYWYYLILVWSYLLYNDTIAIEMNDKELEKI